MSRFHHWDRSGRYYEEDNYPENEDKYYSENSYGYNCDQDSDDHYYNNNNLDDPREYSNDQLGPSTRRSSQRAQDRRGDPRRCFSCREVGHIARNCPENNYDQQNIQETRYAEPVQVLHNNNIPPLSPLTLWQNNSVWGCSGDEKIRTAQAPKPGRVEEDHGCSICFEPYSNKGTHRLVSLKCGHYFGKGCIEEWFSHGQNFCPQCKAPAQSDDLRSHYSHGIKVLDTAKEEALKKELQQERESKRKMGIEMAQLRQHCDSVIGQFNQMKISCARCGWTLLN